MTQSCEECALRSTARRERRELLLEIIGYVCTESREILSKKVYGCTKFIRRGRVASDGVVVRITVIVLGKKNGERRVEIMQNLEYIDYPYKAPNIPYQ